MAVIKEFTNYDGTEVIYPVTVAQAVYVNQNQTVAQALAAQETTADQTYVKKSGDTISGDLVLDASGTGETPAIVFKRGTDSDSYDDWRIVDNSSGAFKIQRRSGSATWNDVASFTNGQIAATTFSGNATTATTATTANNVQGIAGTANSDRHVWFSDTSPETKRNYDDDFKYNPSTNVLTVGSITGSAAKVNNHTVNADVPSGAKFTDTTYTFATGDSNGQIKVTPSGGSAQNIQVKGLGSLAYLSSLTASDVGAATASHTHDVATTSANGFMSSDDKTKLNYAQLNWSTPESSAGQADYYLKIDITSKASWMLSFTVSIYSGYHQYRLQISGYNYHDQNKTWCQPTAKILSCSNPSVVSIPVVFATDGNNGLSLYIRLYGSYGHAIISDVVQGFSAGVVKPGLFVLSKVAASDVPTENITSTNATYGTVLSTGDSNGQVKINGTNVSVKGLAALAYKDNLTKSDVGLGNVDNKSSATIRSEITSSNVTTALGYTPVNKAGDTMSGILTISRSASGDTGMVTKRTDTGMSSAFFGVGSGGVNHGVYSYTLSKWILHADAQHVYLNGTEVPASPKFTDTITKVKGDKQTSYSTGEVNLTPANIGAVNITSGFGQNLSSYASSNDNSISGTVVKYSNTTATGKPTGNDHALFQMAYSDSWKTQLAQDWRTNKAYIRNCNNGTWGDWAELYSTASKPTATDVGLGNVDNTQDLNKPISTATQAALDDKSPLVGSASLTTVANQLTFGDSKFQIITSSVAGGTNKAVGWYRLFKLGAYSSGTIYNHGGYNTGWPTNAVYAITTSYLIGSITQLAGRLKSIFNQVRIIRTSGGEYYLDAYQSCDYQSGGSMSAQFFTFVGTCSTPVEALNPTSVIDDSTTPIATCEAKDLTNGFLPLAGGTMTGTLTAKPNVYTDSYTGALNMGNSNIYGVNSIYTADASENAGEGIHFYRDATHVDTLWMNGGDLLFVPNRALGTSTTKANSQKVGRFTANPTDGKVVVTDGTTGGMSASTVTTAELGYVSGVTSSIQTQLNAKAPLASPALTGTPTAPTATTGTNTTQIATTAFVKTAVDNLINDAPEAYDTLKEISDYISSHNTEYEALLAITSDKQDKITGAATSITQSNLTANRALISDSSGKVAVSGVTSTELGYLNGVTSSIQTQLNGKSQTQHNHDTVYLKLAGGTLTGGLTFPANKYRYDNTFGIDMKNSDIVGVNSIYTTDLSDDAREGIHFYRDSTHYDTLWVKNGDILFTPNRTITTSTSAADSQKVARFIENPTNNKLVVSSGTSGGLNVIEYIGGRNYLLSTKDLSSPWKSESGGTITFDSNVGMYKVEFAAKSSSRWGIYQDVNIEPNTQYTFSCVVLKQAKIGCGMAFYDGAPNSWPQSDVQITTEGKQVIHITKTSGETSAKARIYLHVYPTADDKYGYFYLPKLEKQIISTDWSPNPDDYERVVTGGAQTITSSDLTASRALVSDSSGKVAVSDVTSTELGYLDGVTSAIQTQLNGKQASITGGATTITSSNLTASRALISNSSGKVAVSDVTSTELGYLDGVTSAIQTQLDGKQAQLGYTPVDKAGDTMTGNLVVPKTRIANTYYGVSFGRTTSTPKETLFHTGIKWVSGAHMPVIHITGYAYGLQSPVEFKIGFYIYAGNIGYCGAVNMGQWNPEIYLFKRTVNEIEYVSVAFVGQCYFLQLSADVQDEMGKFVRIDLTDSLWSWEFLTTTGNVPAADNGVTCIKVPYKADILNPSKVNGHTVAKDVPSDALFTDHTYTAATAAPGKIAASSSTGTSTNYARQDHTHGIDLATGDSNGQVKIAGTNVSVKGLGALAYTDSLTKTDVGLGNVDNTADEDKAVFSATKLASAFSIDGVNYDGTAPITHYGVCSDAASQVNKTVACPGFVLDVGSVIYVRFTVTNSGAVANLTLNVNSTGAKHIKYRNANLPAVGDLAAGRTYCFVYDGTYWQWVGDRDTNSNTYDREYVNGAIKAHTAITAGFLTCGTDSGYSNLTKGASFNIAYPVLYQGTAIAANKTRTDFYQTLPMNCTATNGGTSPAFTLYKAVYIKGVLVGSTFTVDQSTLFTQTIPTSEDNKHYYFLGIAYSATNIKLMHDHPIFEYKNGAFQLCARDASTINGHTVNADVPQNAVFTDTTALSSMTGTLSVGHGGTGATSFTSGELLIGNDSNAIGTRSIKNITTKGNLGWTSSTTDVYIPTINTLAYWNGRFNATAQNLTYCVKGEFGDLAVKNSLGKSDVGLGNVDNTSDVNKPISSATQSALDGKQATITGAATSITQSNLTASRALVSDSSGKVAASNVSSTELGYLSGVTSSIQTQLDAKQQTLDYTPVNKAGDTMTGTLIVDGGSTTARIWSGINSSAVSHTIGADSNSGNIYLYATGNANGDGDRGLYTNAHGTGSATDIIKVDTNNNVTFFGSLSGAAQSNVLKTGDTMSGDLRVDNRIWAGADSKEVETDVGARSKSGGIYLYQVGNADGNGNRGIWITSHGTGSGTSVIEVDTNNNTTFRGNLNGGASKVYSTLVNQNNGTANGGCIHFDTSFSNSASGYYNLRHNDSLGFWYRGGKDSSSDGYAIFQIGNATSHVASNGTRGYIRLYGRGANFTHISTEANGANQGVTFPNCSGTVYTTGNLQFVLSGTTLTITKS